MKSEIKPEKKLTPRKALHAALMGTREKAIAEHFTIPYIKSGESSLDCTLIGFLLMLINMVVTPFIKYMHEYPNVA